MRESAAASEDAADWLEYVLPRLLEDTLEENQESVETVDLDFDLDENKTKDSEDDAENHMQKNLVASTVRMVHNHKVSSLVVHLETVHDLVVVACLPGPAVASAERVA